jgi:hypothetical protein
MVGWDIARLVRRAVVTGPPAANTTGTGTVTLVRPDASAGGGKGHWCGVGTGSGSSPRERKSSVRSQIDGPTRVAVGFLAVVAVLTFLSHDHSGASTAAFVAFV